MEVITPKQRETILQLKYQTPEDIKIMGIEYYMAVIRDKITDYQSLSAWRNQNGAPTIIEWMP